MTLRVHLLLVFQDVVQLDISLNCIEVAAIGLLYLILCSELAPIDLKPLSLYLIAVAAFYFLRYLLLASGMMPIPLW